MKTIALAAGLALLAAPAFAAGELPDGTYHCMMEDTPVGDFKIAGDTYAGPVLDGNFGATHNFVVLDGGHVIWLSELPAFDAVGTRVDSTTIRDLGGGKIGFDLVLLLKDATQFSDATCSPV